MKIKCPHCGDEKRSDLIRRGTRIVCARCDEAFLVPRGGDEDEPDVHVDSLGMDASNPFDRAISAVSSQLTSIKWSFPYLHNIVTVIVLLFVICLLLILYPTIGLSVHLAAIFHHLMQQNVVLMRGKNTAEKIGYAVSIGVYFAFFCAFALISSPFYITGWCVGKIVERS